MSRKENERRCPSEECGHAKYIDYSARTMTPQPLCPACMKQQVVAPFRDGSGDDYVEDF